MKPAQSFIPGANIERCKLTSLPNKSVHVINSEARARLGKKHCTPKALNQPQRAWRPPHTKSGNVFTIPKAPKQWLSLGPSTHKHEALKGQNYLLCTSHCKESGSRQIDKKVLDSLCAFYSVDIQISGTHRYRQKQEFGALFSYHLLDSLK